MEISDFKFVLAELRFTAALPVAVLDELAAACSILQLPAGSTIFREGTKNENLYLVRMGRIALEMRVPGRGAVRILTVGPGEMVGWSALLDEGRMTSSAMCLEDSELIYAPAATVLELCEANREFGFHLMRQMADAVSQRLIATRLQLLDMFADVPLEIPMNTLDSDE